MKIWRLRSCENFVCKRREFVFRGAKMTDCKPAVQAALFSFVCFCREWDLYVPWADVLRVRSTPWEVLSFRRQTLVVMRVRLRTNKQYYQLV